MSVDELVFSAAARDRVRQVYEAISDRGTKRGEDRVSLQTVADACGVAKTSVYNFLYEEPDEDRRCAFGQKLLTHLSIRSIDLLQLEGWLSEEQYAVLDALATIADHEPEEAAEAVRSLAGRAHRLRQKAIPRFPEGSG